MADAKSARTPAERICRFLREWFAVRPPSVEVDYARYQCTCHQNMGDEFFWLPLDTCHQGKCDFRVKTHKSTRAEFR